MDAKCLAPALYAARPKAENKRRVGSKNTRITQVFEQSMGPLGAYANPPPSKAFPGRPKEALFHAREKRKKVVVTRVTVTGMLSDVVIAVEVIDSRYRARIPPRMMTELVLFVRCTWVEVR